MSADAVLTRPADADRVAEPERVFAADLRGAVFVELPFDVDLAGAFDLAAFVAVDLRAPPR
ncbi:hypothetical protein [Gordonia effusa]|uniref:hypothetical protein n=1 Tax=Gordonia effusa TaxID=263908 RepID=UPI0002DB414C|nr:hypothetical protein [Gordonia effusa]